MNLPVARKNLSLLLIDDDLELSKMMQEYFLQAGHHLACASNGVDGMRQVLNAKHDLILLDVMLPGMDGISVLQQLRERVGPPVIMLTARGHREDRICGLDAGADDYVSKPFDADELLARIRAVLRRISQRPGKQKTRQRFAGIYLDTQGRTVQVDGSTIDLTALEFDILEMLMCADCQVVTRDEITTKLLERTPSPYDRALDVHVSRLRAKLGSERDLIRTVRGIGYIFSPPEVAP